MLDNVIFWFIVNDMEAKENWKLVVGYEDSYMVSDYGRIKRIKAAQGTSPGKVLSPALVGAGYLAVNLCRNNEKAKQFMIHRVVAGSFIGPCPDGREVNHKNSVKTDNRLVNLEYVTHQGNVNHAHGMVDYADMDKDAGVVRDEKIGIRMSTAEKQSCEKAAQRDSRTFSDWARKQLNKAAAERVR